MHADTIQAHQHYQRIALEYVNAWRGTEPMTSEEQVRRALTVDGEPDDLATLHPYVVDACRGGGLLVVPAAPTTRERIAARLERYSADTADVLSHVAAREARRMADAGTVAALSAEALGELRKLLGREPTAQQRAAVREVVALHLGDPTEFKRV